MTSAPVMYTAEAQRLTEAQLRSILQQRGENPFGSRANLVETWPKLWTGRQHWCEVPKRAG